MAAGLGHLGLAPSEFWAMTPRELAAAMRGRFGGTTSALPRKDDLAVLMRRFPD